MPEAQTQTNGETPKYKVGDQLPLDASTVRLLIQAMHGLNERMAMLESRLEELGARFDILNSSHKQLANTLNVYFTQQAEKEARMVKERATSAKPS